MIRAFYKNIYSFIAVSVIPPLLVALAGKILRIDRTHLTAIDVLRAVLPELMVYLAFALILLLGAYALRQSRATVWLLSKMAVLILSVFLLLLEVVAHLYVSSSGSYDLDLSLAVHVVANIVDLWPVMASEFNPLGVSIGVAGIILYLTLLIFLGFKASVDHLADRKLANYIKGFLAVFIVGLSAIPYSSDMRIKPLVLLAVERSLDQKNGALTADYADIIPRELAVSDTLYWPKPDRKKPNVVLVVLESTGYLRALQDKDGIQVAPYLQKLAKEGRSFNRAYSFIPHTSKSLESILCGIEPTLSLEVTSGKLKNNIAAKCLPPLLSELGYRTLYISPVTGSFEYRTQFLKNVQFDTILQKDDLEANGYNLANGFGYEEDIMLPAIKKQISAMPSQPFFMTLLTLTPHHPYTVSKGFEQTSYTDEKPLNGYLNGLKYQDNFLKKLMDVFRAQGMLENTIFLFVGDHGEAFGEHGLYAHDTILYDETMRVPFVIWAPDYISPETITKPVSLLDTLPTVVDLIGAAFKGGVHRYAGTDMKIRAWDDPVYSYCYRRRYCASVVVANMKYIDYFGGAPAELYDLNRDPSEQNNIAALNPQKLQDMQRRLYRYLDSADKYYQAYFKSGRALASGLDGVTRKVTRK